MDAVRPITALYWGPVAAWLYVRRGRRESPRWTREHGEDLDRVDEQGGSAAGNGWATSKGTSHCGAGCTLGDICGEWLVFATAWTIALFGVHDADSLMAMFVADFAFAWTLGIVFQYFSIVPMRDVGRLRGLGSP